MNQYQICRTVFLQCTQQFDSNATLRAVFADGKLITYQKSIPEGNSIEERVDKLLNYLGNEKFADGKPVLSYFINALSTRYQPGQLIFDELNRLGKRIEIEWDANSTVEIPFVVAAMTDSQAQELTSGNIFNRLDVPPEARIQFHEFKSMFDVYTNDWVSHYNSNRNYWVPYINTNQTIQEIVWDIAEKANEKRSETQNDSMLRPIYISGSFFSDDPAERAHAWNFMVHARGVLIIDAVSLYHPDINILLNRSHLSANPNIAVVVLYPGDLSSIPVNQKIDREILSRMEREYHRFSEQLDKLCEFGAGNISILRRWLFSTLLDTAEMVDKFTPKSSNSERIRQIMGEPTGMDQLIFGKGTVK